MAKDKLIYASAARKAILDADPKLAYCIDSIPGVDAVKVVRCKGCKHWHEETGWCTKHSHFVGFDGMACHPSQSSEWKMFDADDYCSCGERKYGD